MDTDLGSLWLTRPSDIHSHLACAAAERRPVTLVGGGSNAQGVFQAPELSGPLFQPDTRGVVLPPWVGATVRAEYFALTDAYSFFTRLITVDPRGRWLLQSPIAVERCDRRAARRHVVVGVSGFCFRLATHSGQPLLGLYDVSDQGMAFVADSRRLVFHHEERIFGVLHLPGEMPLEVHVEVRHSRDYPRQPHLRIYGTRFVNLEAGIQAALSEFVTTWRSPAAR
jgi:hypothetical protein